MNASDQETFAHALRDLHVYYGVKVQASNIWWQSLSKYPLVAVMAAMQAHLEDPEEGTFPPKVAHIIGQIQRAVPADGRLSADEAWAIAVKAFDEANTVVWTQEIADAWGVAREIYAIGDEVGARHAFLAVYDRNVSTARSVGQCVQWLSSRGHDPKLRAEALEDAATRLGLPHLREQALLEHDINAEPTDFARDCLAKARAALAESAIKTAAEEKSRIEKIIEGLPEGPKERRRAISKLDTPTRYRVSLALGEMSGAVMEIADKGEE